MAALVTITAVCVAIYYLMEYIPDRWKATICGAAMILGLITGGCGLGEFGY